MIEPKFMRHLIAEILDTSALDDWTVHGLGVLRYYVADVGRIHIWHKDLQVPGVSMIHNHAWDLKSMVLCGAVQNVVYERDARIDGLYRSQSIVTGVGGGPKEGTTPSHWDLHVVSDAVLMATEDHCPAYAQYAAAIHETRAENGAVTLVRRDEQGQSHSADVYWLATEQWVSAEPRKATDEDQRHIWEAATRLREGT